VVDALVEFKTNHVVIKDVLKNSSLASSGVVPGDKIIRVGNSTVRNITSLRSALRAYPLGEKIEVFFRNSKSGTEFKIVTNGGESLGLVIE
jgi:S1-C subfamily serine protease